MSSQVKNLRAMFEQQKQDAGPPDKTPADDRGRSPAESSTGASTPPARPLSKVRTSFVVAVEKDGRVGLRRDPSSDSIPTNRSLSQRRLSSNTEEGSASVFSDKANNMSSAPEPIPESPRQPPATRTNGDNGEASAELGAVVDKPSHNPDKHIDEEAPTPKLLPANPTEKPSSATLDAVKNTPSKASKASASKEAPKSAAKTASKPQPVSTKQPAAKTPAKSPSLAKKPSNMFKSASGPLPTRTAKEPTKKAADKAPAPRTAASPTTRTSTKPTTSSTTKASAPASVRIPASSSTGFVKPKVKSPTRPVNLPSSLMAGTASSQSKLKDGGRDTLSPRPSGSAQSLGRSPSRASVSTTGTSTTAAKTGLKRQKSTISHSRPSLGPPPKKAGQDPPVSKQTERDVDEGFLARMARPTVSSASKFSDKAPATPPRKGTGSVTGGAPRSTTQASSTATSTRKVAPSFSGAQIVTGSPGPKQGATPEKLHVGEAEAEPSAIEQAEVEEALREATTIPEVSEPVEPVLVAGGAAVSETAAAPQEVEPERPGAEELKAEEPQVEEPQVEESLPLKSDTQEDEEKESEIAAVGAAPEEIILEQTSVPEVSKEAETIEATAPDGEDTTNEAIVPEVLSKPPQLPPVDTEPATAKEEEEEPVKVAAAGDVAENKTAGEEESEADEVEHTKSQATTESVESVQRNTTEEEPST